MQNKDIYESSWGTDQLELRGEIKNWIKSAIRRQSGTPWRGGHDEGCFACTWGDYYKLSGDESVKDFLIWFRDSFLEWSKENQYHGFQGDAREHSNHSFENAEEFIAALYDMDPTDKVNVQIMEDIAHHVGNWVDGIPAWYDWKKHRFVSHWLGTKNVKNYPPYDFELASHARIGSVVLYAYKASKNERYLHWCKDYADKWVNIIENSKDRIPMVTYPREMTPEERMKTYNFGRERYGDPYLGNLWVNITAHVVNFILKVYEFVKEPRYLEAVKKALKLYNGIMEQERLINLYLQYQEITGEDIYRNELMRWYEDAILSALDVEQKLPDCLVITRKRGRSFGFYQNNGTITIYKGPTPSMFLKAFKISGNFECLRRAMPLAAKQLNLVTYSTRDGREHGCASHRYIHGIGEEASGVLYYATGIDKVSYYISDGSIGLEEGIAVICDFFRGNPVFYFYNGTGENKTVKIALKEPGFRFKEVEVNGKLTEQSSKDIAKVELEYRKVSRVKINLE